MSTAASCRKQIRAKPSTSMTFSAVMSLVRGSFAMLFKNSLDVFNCGKIKFNKSSDGVTRCLGRYTICESGCSAAWATALGLTSK
eukprot:scaffold3806_cov1952-Pavlova_lutheri.AAC.1